MELKDFVKHTILDIAQGIQEANTEATVTGGVKTNLCLLPKHHTYKHFLDPRIFH